MRSEKGKNTTKPISSSIYRSTCKWISFFFGNYTKSTEIHKEESFHQLFSLSQYRKSESLRSIDQRDIWKLPSALVDNNPSCSCQQRWYLCNLT